MLVGRTNHCGETKMHYSKNKNVGGLLLINYKPIPTIECSVSLMGVVELVQFCEA
jgi:hypothetical protein